MTHLFLIEFSYNNSYHSSIRMAPYEALYGRKCRSPLVWDKSGRDVNMSLKLLQETIEMVKLIRERLRVAQDCQRKYVDLKWCKLVIISGDHAFIRVSLLKGVFHFGKKGKLAPRYIGPY